MKRKHLFGITAFLGFFGTLVSCNQNVTVIDKEVRHVVDSVEYHGIGHDNTLQSTPYWRVHFKDVEYTVTSHRSCEVGDTIVVIERTLKRIENGK